MRRRRNRFDYVTILSPENWYESRLFEGKYPDLIQVYANHKSRLSYAFLHCGFTVPAVNSSTTIYTGNGINAIVGWENTYKKIWAKTLTIKCVASNLYLILYKSGTLDILITTLSDLSTFWINSYYLLTSHWLYVIYKNSINVTLNCYVLHCLAKSVLSITLGTSSKSMPNYVLNITDNINSITCTYLLNYYSINGLKKVIIDTDKKIAIGCASTLEFVIKNKKHYYLLNEGISIDSTENAPDFDVNNISSEKFYSGMGILMYDDAVIQMRGLKFNTATFKNILVLGVYNCLFNHINLTQTVHHSGLSSTKIHTISIADDILNLYCFNLVNWDVLPTTSNSVKVMVEAVYNYLNGYSYDNNNILMLDLGIQNKLYLWNRSFISRNICLFLKGGSLNKDLINYGYTHGATLVYCDLIVITDKKAFLHPFNMSNRNCFCIHKNAYEESGYGFRFIPYVNSNNEYIECFKQDESGVYSHIDRTLYDYNSVSLAYNEDGSMKALSKDEVFKSCDLVYTGSPLDTTVCTTIPYAGIWIKLTDSSIYLITSTINAPVLFDNSIKQSVANVFRFQTIYKIKTAINLQWIDDRLPDGFVYPWYFIMSGSLENLDLSHNAAISLYGTFMGSIKDSLKIKTSTISNAAEGARTFAITSNNTYILDTTIKNHWFWLFDNRKNLYYLGTDTNSIETVESYLPYFDSITRLDPDNQSIVKKRYYYINKYEDLYWFLDGIAKITYNEKTYELDINGVTATHDFNFNALSKSSGDSIYLHFGKVSSLGFYKPLEDENTGEIAQTKIYHSINNSIWNTSVFKPRSYGAIQTTLVDHKNLYYIDLSTTDSNVKSRSMKYKWGLNNGKLLNHPNLDGVNQLVIDGPVYEIKILRNGTPTYWWLPVKNTDGETVLKDIIHDV